MTTHEHKQHVADDDHLPLDEEPRSSKARNPDLDTTLISIRITKEDAAFLDAEVLSRKHFGQAASRTGLLAEIVGDWRERQAHKLTLQQNLLRGNRHGVDSAQADLVADLREVRRG